VILPGSWRSEADIPPGLAEIGATDEGREWLTELPRLVERCADRWGLTIGEPFAGSQVSLVLAATVPDGTDAVLKIQWPHRESEYEIEALQAWAGKGAVLPLDHDAQAHAMLLERCVPGFHLSTLDEDEALGVMIGLLPRLWVPVDAPIGTLVEEAAWWHENLELWSERAGHPFSEPLLRASLEALSELPATQGEQVLLHQDLHPDNVLRATREPWLAIDPKPLVGEREFSVAPIVRAYELGHSEDSVRGRLHRLTAELGLDRERARLWTMVQTLAWAIDSGEADPWHVQTAEWLLTS
jgi:streptomycin 6-kinase